MQLHPLSGDVRLVVEREGKEKTITYDPTYKTHLFGFSYSAQKTDKAEVSSVSEDSPFEKAGIKQGDIITAVNGEKVSNGAELAQTIDKYNKDGNEISF